MMILRFSSLLLILGSLKLTQAQDCPRNDIHFCDDPETVMNDPTVACNDDCSWNLSLLDPNARPVPCRNFQIREDFDRDIFLDALEPCLWWEILYGSLENFRPSASPSEAPSNGPTFSPSAAPSFVPSHAPTVTASAAPSGFPSLAPTVTASNAPSGVPSLAPTRTLSEAPSSSTSSAPSLSNLPSISGSQAPSGVPSVEPSYYPSASPSTSSPSSSPSLRPTSTPSISPTGFPTVSVAPSSAPSDPPMPVTFVMSPILVSLRFRTNDVERRLVELDYEELATLTGQHIRREWPELAEANLRVAPVLQEPRGAFSFVTIAIRGNVTYLPEVGSEIDEQELLESVFEGQAGSRYTFTLQSSRDPTLSAVLGTNAGLPTTDIINVGDDDDDFGTIIIAVIAACGAVIVAMLCLIFWICRTRSDNSEAKEIEEPENKMAVVEPEEEEDEGNSDGEVRSQAVRSEVTSVYSYANDQSTLGDTYNAETDDEKSYFSKLWSAGGVNAKKGLAPQLEEEYSHGEDSSRAENSMRSGRSGKSGLSNRSPRSMASKSVEGVSRFEAETSSKGKAAEDVLQDPDSYIADSDDEGDRGDSPVKIGKVIASSASVASAMSQQTHDSKSSKNSRTSKSSRRGLRGILGMQGNERQDSSDDESDDNMKYLDSLVKSRDASKSQSQNSTEQQGSQERRNSFDSQDESILTM